MKKKIIAGLLIILLINFSFINVFASSKSEIQNKIDDKKEELQDVKDEKSSVLTEIDKLNTSISSTEKEISDLNSKIDNLTSSISEKTTEIEKKENEFKEKDKLLQDRLVALYEAGDTTYLDVLLSSASITDFISNYYLIERLADYDSQLLTKIESQKKELEESKSKIEEEEKKLQELKSNAIKLTTTLKNSRTLQKSKMDKLTEEEKGIQEEINKYKIEEANIENQIKQATNDGEYQLQYTGGVMLWPVAKEGTVITSPFGTRNHPIQGVVKLHSGIDIGGAGYGAKVVAAEDGVVSFAGTLGGYGNCVIVNHGGGISTLYGHGQTLLTTVGTNVKKGDIIMEVGSTGNSTGPHLHFEVRVNNIAVNPATYLQGS